MRSRGARRCARPTTARRVAAPRRRCRRTRGTLSSSPGARRSITTIRAPSSWAGRPATSAPGRAAGGRIGERRQRHHGQPGRGLLDELHGHRRRRGRDGGILDAGGGILEHGEHAGDRGGVLLLGPRGLDLGDRRDGGRVEINRAAQRGRVGDARLEPDLGEADEASPSDREPRRAARCGDGRGRVGGGGRREGDRREGGGGEEEQTRPARTVAGRACLLDTRRARRLRAGRRRGLGGCLFGSLRGLAALLAAHCSAWVARTAATHSVSRLARGHVEELVRAVRVRPRPEHAGDAELRLGELLAEHGHERDRAALAHAHRGLAEEAARGLVERLLEPRRQRRARPSPGSPSSCRTGRARRTADPSAGPPSDRLGRDLSDRRSAGGGSRASPA